VGLAHHVSAGMDELLDHRRGACRRFVQRKPVRVARAGHMARDVEEVLGRKRESGKRARRRALQGRRGMGAEGVQGIGGQDTNLQVVET